MLLLFTYQPNLLFGINNMGVSVVSECGEEEEQENAIIKYIIEIISSNS